MLNAADTRIEAGVYSYLGRRLIVEDGGAWLVRGAGEPMVFLNREVLEWIVTVGQFELADKDGYPRIEAPAAAIEVERFMPVPIFDETRVVDPNGSMRLEWQYDAMRLETDSGAAIVVDAQNPLRVRTRIEIVGVA